MVQRAAVTQICKGCTFRCTSRLEMDEHAARYHQTEEDPTVWLSRSEDQREFKPCLSQTPWGSDLR